MTSNIAIFLPVVSFLLVGSACGSNPNNTTPPASVTGVGDVGFATALGSIGNYTLTPKAATAVPFSNGLSVILSDQTNYCADVTAKKIRPNQHSLELIFGRVGSNGVVADVVPGTYTFFHFPDPPNAFLLVTLKASDLSCTSIAANLIGKIDNVKGTATLTSVTDTLIVGNFSIEINSETISGNFSAPICGNVTARLTDGTNSFTCSPG